MGPGVRSIGLLQWLSGKESPCNAGNTGDVGSIPGLEISPGGGHGNPLQYSCLENPMDRGDWWAEVQCTKSQTRLKQLTMHMHIYINHPFLDELFVGIFYIALLVY